MALSSLKTLSAEISTLLLVFLFSGCGEKNDVGGQAKTSVSLEPPGAEGESLSGETIPAKPRELLYQAAVDNNFQSDEALETIIDDYRKTVYGNIFLESYMSGRINVTMEEVRDQYLRNRPSFQRHTDEVRVLHFVVKNAAAASAIRGELLQYDADLRASLLQTFKVSPTTVSPGDLPQNVDRILFGSSRPRGVLGPVETSYGYHVLEVLEFFSRGSYRGLDEVYDQVSQSLYQIKRAAIFDLLLDSLRTVYPTQVPSVTSDKQ